MNAKLTAHARAGGCASKLSPKILDQALARLPRVPNDNVLVGFDTSDDAGVYKLTSDCALVQTVDFFTPVVDDPETFGAIAAANALSDVYAMGGRPLTALSVLAWRAGDDLEILAAILRGGAEKIHEAGCTILGGHSVNDEEIKFGYAVTGTIHPERIKTNAGARPGDVLVFTKRIGTGVISTALKRGAASEAHVQASIASMLELNRRACEAMLQFDVHGCTDVTGFGLLGHGREMAMASGVTLEIRWRDLNWLDGAIQYAEAGMLPGGLKNNRDFAGSCVDMAADIPESIAALLYDPQTSGGLLIALPESDAAQLERVYPAARRIGKVTERSAKPIHVL